MPKLPEEIIARELGSLNGWSRRPQEITKTFVKNDFIHAMGFVNSVALLAEKANHHPDIDIRWNTVILSLSTHSEGGITEKDFNLAKEIDQL